MASMKSIAKLLKFKDLKVTDLSFHRNRMVRIAVKPWKNGCRCPECGRRGKIVRTRPRTREWRDIPVGGWTLWLTYAPREIDCSTHGRVEESIPWAERYARVTHRYEYVMLRYCQMMSQKAAAQLLHVAPSTLSEQLHRCIKRARSGHRIRGLKTIGIDEIAHLKNHKYAPWSMILIARWWFGSAKERVGTRPMSSLTVNSVPIRSSKLRLLVAI